MPPSPSRATRAFTWNTSASSPATSTFCGRAVGADAAALEHHDAVARARREAEVVQRDDRGAPALDEPAEERHRLELVERIEVRRRLVEEHDGRPLGEGARQVRALELARGERVDGPIGEREDVGQGHRLLDRARVLLGGASEPPLEGDAAEGDQNRARGSRSPRVSPRRPW